MSELYTAAILAAGAGRRAGGYKPLMALGKGLVVDRVLAAASAVAHRVRVVGGAEFARLEAHLAARWPDVEILHNEAWDEGGMFSSVRLGLAGISGPAFVHPADIPGPGEDVYRALAAAFESRPCDVVRPVFGGRRGHPVLLSSQAVRAVHLASPDATLRDALTGLPSLDVDAPDDLVLCDFDTADALDSLRARLG